MAILNFSTERKKGCGIGRNYSGYSREGHVCQNSGSRHKNLPLLALERTLPNFHMLAWSSSFSVSDKKDWSERALACACFVVLAVIVKYAKTAVLRHKVDWQSLRGGRVGGRSLDIVSKFEPTILCDIRSWDDALFPPGHFDMVWASPVCTE